MAGVKIDKVLFTKELFIGYQFSQCDVYMHVLPGDVEFKSCVFFFVQLHRIEVTLRLRLRCTGSLFIRYKTHIAGCLWLV